MKHREEPHAPAGPVYPKRIFEQVRDLIEEDVRDRKPGEPIDSEIGYARRFGVSRPTARKAVEALIRIGLIRRVPGKGLVMASEGEVPSRGKLLIALPHEVGDGFLFQVMLGCVEQANALGFEYKIIGARLPAERLALIQRERLSDYVAAVTCAYETPEEYAVLDLLQAACVPFLLMDNPPKREGFPTVMCDDFDGGRRMGAYLAGKGHRRILNLSSTRGVLTVERRDAGFLQAMSEAGIRHDPALLAQCAGDYTELLRDRFTPADFGEGGITAVCSHTSLAIVEASRWLQQNGLRVPEDVSLMGYGDHPWLPSLNTPCTIIGVPSVEMGRSAVDEISAALLERRPMRSVVHEVWLEKRHTVRNLK